MRKKIIASNLFSIKAQKQLKKDLSHYELEFQNISNFSCSKSEALVVRSKDSVHPKILEGYPALQTVISATAGFDHIAFKDLTSLTLCYCPEANAQSAMELTLFHILNLIKKGPNILNPEGWRQPSMLSSEIKNKKIGILGLGRIGGKLARVLDSMGAQIFFYDPYVTAQTNFQKMEKLEELLSLCDLVSLHAPSTQKTKKMISGDQLACMKSEAFLVNCARGSLVDQEALVKALQKKQIAGAALDVFEEEPLTQQPGSLGAQLRALKNLYWSPHLGAYTLEAQINSAKEAALQVDAAFKNKKELLKPIPPQVEWAKDL